ncbi:MAG TPA: hypothetical protein VKF32_00090 [Thermoanaerobaculia bacterium]|nr:hypothetical protein [Thermoanaerobaculia bacterium]
MLVALLVLLAQLVPSHAREAPSSGAGLAWEVPKAWEAAAVPSPMRLATYRLPAAPGDPERPELGVFYFGAGQGGSVEANVARWLSQFEAEKGKKSEPPAKLTVHGIPVTVVLAEGTYASGMPGGPTTPHGGWALLGAIAEGPEGAVFFKLTGPKKSVEKARSGFDALVASLRKASKL